MFSLTGLNTSTLTSPTTENVNDLYSHERVGCRALKVKVVIIMIITVIIITTIIIIVLLLLLLKVMIIMIIKRQYQYYTYSSNVYNNL